MGNGDVGRHLPDSACGTRCSAVRHSTHRGLQPSGGGTAEVPSWALLRTANPPGSCRERSADTAAQPRTWAGSGLAPWERRSVGHCWRTGMKTTSPAFSGLGRAARPQGRPFCCNGVAQQKSARNAAEAPSHPPAHIIRAAGVAGTLFLSSLSTVI